MVYETFLKTVKSSLQERLGDDFQLVIQSVTKNNGLTLDGICIGKEGEKAAPAIYLNSFYENFRMGCPFSMLLDEILSLYQSTRLPEDCSLEEFSDFEGAKSKIVYRLINEPANREMLKDLPHISFSDLELCLIFCITSPFRESDFLTALIHNWQMEIWNMTTEELYITARENTPRLFPARIRSMPELIKEMARNAAGKDLVDSQLEDFFTEAPLSPPLYVLTNSMGMHGAGCLLYEGVLKDFGAAAGKDLVILPSSIHEVLILPYDDDVSLDDLADTVFTVNLAEVPKEDRLSNHIYSYSRKTDRLSVAFTSSVPIGTMNP